LSSPFCKNKVLDSLVDYDNVEPSEDDMNSDQREVVVISFMLLSPILMALMLSLINTFSS
jgi:hypothetical protein